MPTNQADPEFWTCIVNLRVGDRETLKSHVRDHLLNFTPIRLAESKPDKSFEIDLTKKSDVPTNQIDPEFWTCIVKLTVGEIETLK